MPVLKDRHATIDLGAEYGGGLPFMYRRRTVVSPDDIAAMVPVQLGPGALLSGSPDSATVAS
jgi:hypothetical protein